MVRQKEMQQKIDEAAKKEADKIANQLEDNEETNYSDIDLIFEKKA